MNTVFWVLIAVAVVIAGVLLWAHQHPTVETELQADLFTAKTEASSFWQRLRGLFKK